MQTGPALRADGSSPRVSGLLFGPGGDSAGGGPSPAPCDVRLSLCAQAEQVVLARQVVASVARSLGFPESSVQDVRLAVTEACTNVVRHAYDGPDGRFDVAAAAQPDGLEVTIADRGCGLKPRVDGGPGGLGLPLMAALASSVEFAETDGRGTTVRLSFAPAE